MNRRSFLTRSGTLLATSNLPPAQAGAASSGTADKTTGSREPATATRAGPVAAPSATARQVLSLNRNWRYSPRTLPEAPQKTFDDSAFEPVTLPHSNIRLPWHSFDEKSYQFISTYRRRFRLPAAARGRHVFVDFEGVMTASTVWLNGVRLGEYKGGFTPFSFELTPHLDFEGENVLVVEVDSHERADIPPFGYQVDYLTFGGIYREVSLRIVAASFLENVFVRPLDVLSKAPRLEVDCFVQDLAPRQAPLRVEVDLLDGERVIAKASASVPALEADAGTEQHMPTRHTVRFGSLPSVKLWDIDRPQLYRTRVKLFSEHQLLDEDVRRFGFRSARFTERGFELNGHILKLRGLNRHQNFPFVGPAMPARVQRRDAEILRKELKCNIVRTSHYPQSRHFLDACDEWGLLVLEEIPGWQHIGDESWKALSVDNVRRMIRRDWNHPSIVLWGVRINESSDDDAFYTRTNSLAHELDPTRQTGGIRAFRESKLLEDVFTLNDFGFPLKEPNHPLYLNTEFVGHTYNTRNTDSADRLIEHTLRHARIHDQLASDPRYAGGIGWCAFDYNTHANFGSGDRMCYHGVADIFREPKPAAGFYRSQCTPDEEAVIEPALHWAPSDEAGGLYKIVICSNCEHLKLFISGKPLLELDPDRRQFPHLKYPPFVAELTDGLDNDQWGDLRIEGYIGGQRVAVKQYSGLGVDQKLTVAPDDTQLVADGADATRVVLRITDEFGNVRPLANGPITLEIDGPADLIGDNPFALVGGVGAVWIRARELAGAVSIKARHPILGEQIARIDIQAAAPEPA